MKALVTSTKAFRLDTGSAEESGHESPPEKIIRVPGWEERFG
jgi:hypothetical protein